MTNKKYLALLCGTLLILISLISSLIVACATAPAPAPSPTPTPTAAPKPTATPTPAPTAIPKPTSTPAPTTQIPQYRFTASASAVGASGHLLTTIIAAKIREWTNDRIMISVLPGSGSLDAANRLRAKEVQLQTALDLSGTVNLMTGTGLFKGMEPVKVNVLYPYMVTSSQLVMLDDSPIKTWDDLAGKTVAAGVPGSQGASLFSQELEIMGLTGKVNLIYASYSAMMDAVRDRKVDAAHMWTGLPNANISELGSAHKFKMLDYPDKLGNEMDKLLGGGYGCLPMITIPKESYTGLVADARAMSSPIFPSVLPDFPEDAAYWIVKLIWDHSAELVKLNPAFNALKPDILKNLPAMVQYHPGAMRYYKEAGLLK